MTPIPEKIRNFMNANKVATICFNDGDDKPYCISCFFAFDEQHRVLLFKSSAGAYHEDYVRIVNNMAGTILPESIDLLNIKGIQFTGKTLPEAEIEGLELARAYYAKFPFGRAMKGYIWAIRPESIKFTDNTLGFGKKISWSAFAQPEEAAADL